MLFSPSSEYTPYSSVKAGMDGIAALKRDGRIDQNSATRVNSFLKIAPVIFRDADGCCEFWKSLNYSRALIGLHDLSEFMATLPQAEKGAIPILHSKIVQLVDKLLRNPEIKKLRAGLENNGE